MIKATYSELVQKIAEQTKLGLPEIEKKVDEKKAKLSDLISREGAAQIVAAELGVSFDRQESSVAGLLVGMRRVSVIGKITRTFPAHTFKRKEMESKVMNLLVADTTGMVRCVLWDANHIKLLEEGIIKEGDVVEIKDASVREGMNGKELHLGSTSNMQLSSVVIDNVVSSSSPQKASKKRISELAENERATVRAVIVQVFEPKTFMVCPECGKKPSTEGDKIMCAQHGNIVPKSRALMSFVLDDGTGNIRAVCFEDSIKQIFGQEMEDVSSNLSSLNKNSVLGKEMMFMGRARKNIMYGNIEFTVNSAEEVDPKKLAEDLNNNNK